MFAGKVQMEKPLHLVIGSVTPNSVLLSWGMLLKTPYEGNIMNDCLEDGWAGNVSVNNLMCSRDGSDGGAMDPMDPPG